MNDNHASIGDVLNELRPEFHDVTISKIRFLESQGLIAPERTPSGYRKFARTDVERLRWILAQQRDHFLPLKVIKDRLAELDDGQLTLDQLLADQRPSREEAVQALFERARQAQDSGAAMSAAQLLAEADDSHEQLSSSGVSLTRSELAAASGVSDQQLTELESFGLVVPIDSDSERPLFGDEALTIARTAQRFQQVGIEARHLRMYKAFAERELVLFEQVVGPFRRQRNPDANAKADATRADLAGLGRTLRTALLQQIVRSNS